MSVADLTYREAVRIVREADDVLKDQSYRRFPVGQEIGRFLRAKRVAGRRPRTLDTYERCLAHLAIDHADFDSLEPFTERESGSDLLLNFIDRHWGEADEATIRHRFDTLASFFEWAYRADRISADPVAKLERPRRRKHGASRPPVPDAHVERLVSAQNLRDQALMLLMGRLALRREDIRLLQLGDIDLARDLIYLRHAKGGDEEVLPILFDDVRETLYLHLQERGGHPDEYLLYPKRNRTRPMAPTSVNAWFDRCTARAGLSGYTPHQLRHSAIDWLERDTHDVRAAQLLARHADLATTQLYLHSTVEDLRRRVAHVGRKRS
jgi:site-specific recombinase XerC